MEHVRVCRECGEEYRPGVERCADCGGPLEDRFGEAAATYRRRSSEPDEPPPPPRPGGFETVQALRSAAEAVALARVLEEAGVRFHLAQERGEDPSSAVLVLSVPAADRARAEAALGHDATADVHAHFNPESGYTRCPACGAPAQRGQAECAECGLGLGGALDDEDEERR